MDSATVLRRVVAARERQRHRLEASPGVHCNGQLDAAGTRRLCAPTADGRRLLRRAMDRLELSARGYHRVLRVARTVADLEESCPLRERHVAEALQYRGG